MSEVISLGRVTVDLDSEFRRGGVESREGRGVGVSNGGG